MVLPSSHRLLMNYVIGATKWSRNTNLMGNPMEDLANSPIKVVKCKNCGADVVVNAVYPITSVDSCKNCPDKK